MANPKVHYDFDRFAEFLCVTLAENAARCQLGLNKVQKIRVFTHADRLWPVSFKVILDNELVAPAHPSFKHNQDASYDINYYYRCPSSIPMLASESHRITDPFVMQAKALDSEFYADAWLLNMPGCLPYLLKDMAFRNVSRSLARQLQHQGIDISNDFSVQFHDGENFLSFNYDNLVQQIQQQIQFYLSNDKVKQLAADMCFKHPANKQWFMSL